ncbi:MAG TPA: hypothetical protein VGR26_13705 [Acidimicrobiales bacterium]|nr:hypothetical protein [Acidimicrobiales bacterium]
MWLEKGLFMLEVALPSSLIHESHRTGGPAMSAVVIGVDPHKHLNAVVVLSAKGNVLR